MSLRLDELTNLEFIFLTIFLQEPLHHIVSKRIIDHLKNSTPPIAEIITLTHCWCWESGQWRSLWTSRWNLWPLFPSRCWRICCWRGWWNRGLCQRGSGFALFQSLLQSNAALCNSRTGSNIKKLCVPRFSGLLARTKFRNRLLSAPGRTRSLSGSLGSRWGPRAICPPIYSLYYLLDYHV